MSCHYGCTTEDIDLRCDVCGHPKHLHSPVHPHQCMGARNGNSMHVITSCRCKEFIPKEVNYARTEEASGSK